MLTVAQQKKMCRLISNVYDGFEEYANTLENGDDFRDPMDELVSYIEKIGGFKYVIEEEN